MLIFTDKFNEDLAKKKQIHMNLRMHLIIKKDETIREEINTNGNDIKKS